MITTLTLGLSAHHAQRVPERHAPCTPSAYCTVSARSTASRCACSPRRRDPVTRSIRLAHHAPRSGLLAISSCLTCSLARHRVLDTDCSPRSGLLATARPARHGTAHHSLLATVRSPSYGPHETAPALPAQCSAFARAAHWPMTFQHKEPEIPRRLDDPASR
jgi:hypothetical protein